MYFLPSESYTLVSENKATRELQSKCTGISLALENIQQGEKLSCHLYFTQKLVNILVGIPVFFYFFLLARNQLYDPFVGQGHRISTKTKVTL